MNLPVLLVYRKLRSSFRIDRSISAILSLLLIMMCAVSFVPAQTASTDPPGDWTQFLRDNMERWNPFETVLRVDNAGDLQLKWTQTSNSTLAGYTNPVTANGVVYVGSGNDSHLYAIDAATGQNRWSFNAAGFSVRGTPAVAKGVIYFGAVTSGECNSANDTPCGSVYALNASTGAELWRFSSKDTPITDITVADGVVCFGAQTNVFQGYMYALDTSTGAVRWKLNTFLASTPSVANGVVYFGNGGSVTAVDVSGGILWNYVIQETSETTVFGAPVVADGMVYFATNSNIYAVKASSGKTIWVDAIGGVTTPAVANGVIYAGSGDGNLYALNAITGEKMWSFAVGNFVVLPPAVANGVVYLSAIRLRGSNELIALNASTGAQLASNELPLGLSSPIVSNGNVYITGSSSGSKTQLYAFSVGADLFLRVTPSPTPIHQGNLLTYTFPVWNLGPTNAEFEVLTTEVPQGTAFDHIRISGTAGLGTCLTPQFGGTGIIVCHENGIMAPNTTWTVRLTVKVTAPSGTVITEKAVVLADTLDPNVANNAVTLSTKVQ